MERYCAVIEIMKKNPVRDALAELMGRHLLQHLQAELQKPAEVTDYNTAEGAPFKTVTSELLDKLSRLLPGIADADSPAENIFKKWWDISRRDSGRSQPAYEKTTFNTINQAALFKIADLKDPSQARRTAFAARIYRHLDALANRGRGIEYGPVMSMEILLLQLWLEAAEREGLRPADVLPLLTDQMNFNLTSVYGVLDDLLRRSYERTDQILQSVLPVRIVEELKKTGQVEPRKIDSASIMFCDIVGFTKIAETLAPDELISELNLCFLHFEHAMLPGHMEKIKTIGDSFMCAGGISETDRLHAVDAVICALRIQEFMRKHKKSRERKGLHAWQLRIGIHTGPVVAGILGKERFNYDIWGDSVNIASRIEAAGEAEMVNISAETALLVKDFFDLESRGKIPVKNKADTEMFFVLGIRSELSVGGTGKVPSAEFRKKYSQYIKKWKTRPAPA